MAAYLVWFLLFALFLIVIPIGISPFEAPKVIIAEAGIDLLILVKVIQFKRFRLRELYSPQAILLGLILFLSLDQLLLFRAAEGFFGNPFRLQGLFLLWHLSLFSFISKGVNLSQIPKILYYLSFLFLVIVTLMLGVDENNRAFGSLGEPNALAATTLFWLPFAFFKAKRLKKGLLALAFLIIALSGSRAGLVGFGVEAVFLSLTGLLRVSVFKAALISLVIVVLSISLPFTDPGERLENRSQIWQTALTAGLYSPVLGHGFGNIQAPLSEAAKNLNLPVQYLVVDSSHNFILDFWVQGGIVGVISLLTLIFLSFQGLIKHKKTLEITAFLGILAALLFNPLSVVNLLAFWWLIGQGFE